MADLQANVKQLKVKLEIVKLTRTKTKDAIESGQIDRMKRQRETIYKAIHNLKVQVTEQELGEGETLNDIMSNKFTEEIEVKLKQLDNDIATLAAHTKEIENRYEADQIQKEQTLVAQQRQEQLQFEKEQLELKAKYQNDHGATKVTKTQVKLTKLVLTKFNGKLENWLLFWNTFEVEVDSVHLPAV